MAQQPDPRDTRKPEPRPAATKATDRKAPPKPAIRKIYADWAMI